MTERKPHSDNAMIDELEKDGAPSQSGSSGGSINRDVGSRSEMKNTTGPTETERPTAQDHMKSDNEAKGEKTIARLQPGDDS